MKKKNIISKNIEIQKIIKKNNKIQTKEFIIFKENHNLNFPMFCIAISKKNVKSAVQRNKIRRKIKKILSENISSFPNQKYVFILKKINTKDLNWDNIAKNILNSV